MKVYIVALVLVAIVHYYYHQMQTHQVPHLSSIDQFAPKQEKKQSKHKLSLQQSTKKGLSSKTLPDLYSQKKIMNYFVVVVVDLGYFQMRKLVNYLFDFGPNYLIRKQVLQHQMMDSYLLVLLEPQMMDLYLLVLQQLQMNVY